MRILGLDFGSKTVGVAVTDPLGITAQGVEIIRREKETHMRPTFRRISRTLVFSSFRTTTAVLTGSQRLP